MDNDIEKVKSLASLFSVCMTNAMEKLGPDSQNDASFLLYVQNANTHYYNIYLACQQNNKLETHLHEVLEQVRFLKPALDELSKIGNYKITTAKTMSLIEKVKRYDVPQKSATIQACLKGTASLPKRTFRTF